MFHNEFAEQTFHACKQNFVLKKDVMIAFVKVELCPENSADITLCREGTSLMALVEDPNRDDWKQRVFSQVDRNGKVSVMYISEVRL